MIIIINFNLIEGMFSSPVQNNLLDSVEGRTQYYKCRNRYNNMINNVRKKINIKPVELEGPYTNLLKANEQNYELKYDVPLCDDNESFNDDYNDMFFNILDNESNNISIYDEYNNKYKMFMEN